MRRPTQSDRDMLALLRRIIERRKPGLSPLLNEIGRHRVSDDEREMLRGVVADELVEAGLRPNDEPTAYGLALEAVIDWLGHV
jgi:hypothetical protein